MDEAAQLEIDEKINFFKLVKPMRFFIGILFVLWMFSPPVYDDNNIDPTIDVPLPNVIQIAFYAFVCWKFSRTYLCAIEKKRFEIYISAAIFILIIFAQFYYAEHDVKRYDPIWMYYPLLFAITIVKILSP